MDKLQDAIRIVPEEDREKNREEIMKKLEQGITGIVTEDNTSKKKDPNEREYLLLYVGQDENKEEDKTFMFITGRKAIYDYIKNMIDYIDPEESKVLVEGEKMEGMVTVYLFMKYAQDIFDDGFAIEDYFDEVIIEE